MLQPNPYLFQQASAQCQDRRLDEAGYGVRSALPLYQRARRRSVIGRLWSALTGRSRRLFDLDVVERAHSVRGRRHAGTRAVSLDCIRGSEGRCRDFDNAFYPLQSHDRDRWLSVAAASLVGIALPPVELIQVGKVYFVRDGHHRISVARMRGQRAVDAIVTAWDVAGPLPWEQGTATGALLGQPV
jgi:hypothetical protein